MGALCLYLFWNELLCVLSSFAIILKRERAGCVAFIVLRMSCYCKCSVTLPHVTWVGLQCVIVVFPDHTFLLEKKFA